MEKIWQLGMGQFTQFKKKLYKTILYVIFRYLFPNMHSLKNNPNGKLLLLVLLNFFSIQYMYNLYIVYVVAPWRHSPKESKRFL